MISSVLVGYVIFLLIFCFLYFYLNNADVENCGEVKGFGYIYIYRLNNLMSFYPFNSNIQMG